MSSAVYKILSPEDWAASQKLGYVKPLALDAKFIHLCTKEQIQLIINKFWQGKDKVIVLQLDPIQFQGKLVKETNPGGTTEYYHLYEGKIPLAAVITTSTIELESSI